MKSRRIVAGSAVMAAGAIDLGVGFAVVLGVVGCAHWFLLANGIALGGLMILGGFAYAVRLTNATALPGPSGRGRNTPTGGKDVIPPLN
jgi:hypothetical protein